MSQAPFVFGKLAGRPDFTNRAQELTELITNFRSGVNTVLISPRRWGKSSLVEAASEDMEKDKKIRFAFLDLFNVRSEEAFYEMLANEIIRQSSSKIEEFGAITRQFLGKFIPKITYSPEALNEISIGLDWKEVKKDPIDILNMAEKIATAKGWKWVICIDEFQQVTTFDSPLSFQKKLRANWQRQKRVTYCLYGSKRHMLTDVFTSPSMPFYKFGSLMYLQKIESTHWVSFIQKRFSDTGKKIKAEDAALIAALCENHPYYVQQLAQQVWLRSGKTATTANIDTAHQSLMMQLSMLFQSMTDGLTSTQINLIRAVLDGAEQLSARTTLQHYKLGTSANVLRIKHALIQKEIIDTMSGKIEMLDPLYKAWLKQEYFTMP